MTTTDLSKPENWAIGHDVVIKRIAETATSRNYLVERPGYRPDVRAVEAILELTIDVPYPARNVWPAFADFNSWMSRFGYVWDQLPVNNENCYVYLGDTAAHSGGKYETGEKTRYVVRKVIPEQLIYFDSLPLPFADSASTWSGHNLMSLHEKRPGATEISVFMEHTWYSKALSSAELSKSAREAMYGFACDFWRDYFVPDMIAQIRKTVAKL